MFSRLPDYLYLLYVLHTIRQSVKNGKIPNRNETPPCSIRLETPTESFQYRYKEQVMEK